MTNKWKSGGKDIEYTVVGSFSCPFCAHRVDVVSFSNETEEGTPGVIHEAPTCSPFDASEPQEFVRRALDERVKSLTRDQQKRRSPPN